MMSKLLSKALGSGVFLLIVAASFYDGRIGAVYCECMDGTRPSAATCPVCDSKCSPHGGVSDCW
jgi:hypothetical protein